MVSLTLWISQNLLQLCPTIFKCGTAYAIPALECGGLLFNYIMLIM